MSAPASVTLTSTHRSRLPIPSRLRLPSHQRPSQPLPPYDDPRSSSRTLIPEYSSSPRLGDVYQRDLEANYCKNFSCCGLTLGDLHALLQHYEESHVHFEEDDDNGHPVPAGFTDDDGWSTSSDTPTSPRANGRHPSHLKGTSSSSSSSAAANAAAAATVAALTAGHHHHQQHQQQSQHHLQHNHHQQQQQQQQQQRLSPLSFLNSKKKTNGVSLSDIYSEDHPGLLPTDDAVSAFPNSILRTAAQAEFTNLTSNKRDLSAYSTSFDTHSPMAKKISTFQNLTLTSAAGTSAAATNTATPHKSNTAASTLLNNTQPSMTTQSQQDILNSVTDYLDQAMQQGLMPDCEVGSPAYLLAAEDLIRKREELVSIMESIGKTGTPSADKPYRCTVSGCDKSYKNPNGLKYHNQHGHCSASGLGEADVPESKPYMCTFLECGKRYKNLNGLKYHIEHSHPNLTPALRAHQAGLTSHPLLLNGAFANNPQAALTLAAALSAVEASPMMMQAINAITASAANNVNNNTNNSNSNNNSNNSNNRTSPPTDNTPDTTPSPHNSPALRPTAASTTMAPGTHSLTAYRGGDNNVFSTDVTPMTSPVLSRATLPGLSPLSIHTGTARATGMTGLMTPSSLSPTLAQAAPKSPTSVSQVSTLTAALAAVTVEQQRQQLHQLQQQQGPRSVP
ncbi:Transcriptional regulator of ribosomal biogenesis protein, partial [Mortierella polycephala]